MQTRSQTSKQQLILKNPILIQSVPELYTLPIASIIDYYMYNLLKNGVDIQLDTTYITNNLFTMTYHNYYHNYKNDMYDDAYDAYEAILDIKMGIELVDKCKGVNKIGAIQLVLLISVNYSIQTSKLIDTQIDKNRYNRFYTAIVNKLHEFTNKTLIKKIIKNDVKLVNTVIKNLKQINLILQSSYINTTK